MHGITETKDAIRFMVAFGNAVDAAAENGFGWEDAMLFIPVATKAPAAFGGMEDILKELGDIDETERKELQAEVEELDIRNDATEAVIEAATQEAMVVSASVQRFIKVLKASRVTV